MNESTKHSELRERQFSQQLRQECAMLQMENQAQLDLQQECHREDVAWLESEAEEAQVEANKKYERCRKQLIDSHRESANLAMDHHGHRLRFKAITALHQARERDRMSEVMRLENQANRNNQQSV